MSKKAALEKKLEAQLELWSARLKVLKAQVKKLDAKSEARRHEHIEKLHSMEIEARKKLDELKNAGENTWEHIEEGANKFWASLGRELKAYDESPK